MKLTKTIFIVFMLAFSMNVLVAGPISKKKKKKKDENIQEQIAEPKLKILTEKEQDSFYRSFAEGLRTKSLGQIEKSITHFMTCIRINPTSASTYYELSALAIMTNHIDDALNFSRKAVEYNPSHKWYLMQLAQIYQYKAMITQAGEIYDRLITLYPFSKKYYIYKTSMLVSVEEWDKALDVFTQMENQFGYNESISLKKQNLLLKLGRREEAYKELQKLIVKYPKKVDYRGLLADMYIEDKRSEKAFEQYQKILEIDPDNGMVHFFFSDYHMKKKEYEKAFEEFERALIDKEVDPFFKMQRLLLLEQDSVAEEKMLDFSRLFTIQNPELPPGHLLYAKYLQLNEEYEKAKEELLKVLDVDTANYVALQRIIIVELNLEHNDSVIIHADMGIKNYPQSPIFYFYKGIAFLNLDNLKEAESNFLKGRSEAVNNEELRIQFTSVLAETYYKMKKAEEAFRLYDEILLYDPENIVVLNNYGYYLALRKEKLNKAEQMSRKCIEREPNNSTYLDTYAWILYVQQEYESAKEYMKRAVENMGEDYEQGGIILEHYGDILFKLGKQESALEYWQRAIEMGSEDDKLLQEKINKKELIEKEK